MLLQQAGFQLSSALSNLWIGIVMHLPAIVLAIIIFVIGWVVGSVVGKAIAQVITSLKIDNLFKGTGFEEALTRGGFKLSVGGFFGGLVKWFLIIVFLMASLEMVGLSQINVFLSEVVVSFLPNVFIAAFVLVIAGFVADAAKKIVMGSVKATSVARANLFGAITVYAIWIFAFIIALSQLGIAERIMNAIFIGIIAMLSLAGGLAFGLGGRDAAARVIEHMKSDVTGR